MRRSITAATFLAVLALPLFGDEQEPRTLKVTGTAELSVTPDICFAAFAVETRNKNASQAYAENNRIMNQVNAAIKDEGIDAKDLQSSNFTIRPEYHYDRNTNRRIFDGYVVTHTLNVKIRDLEMVPGVLDAAVTAGANQVMGVNFTVQNPKDYADEVRAEAFQAAQKKAKTIASLTGVRLLEPLSISESEPGDRVYYPQTSMMRDGGAFAEAQPTLEPGEIKLTHTVYITYEIQ